MVNPALPTDTVNYRKVGATVWNVNVVSYHDTRGTFTFCDTASPCTKYEWRVRNNCLHNDSTYSSINVTGLKFNTGCDTGHLLRGIPMKLFPNPARSSVRLSANFPSSGSVMVTITDMLGNKKIERRAFITNKTLDVSVDVANLPKGIYFITVTDGKTISKTNFIKE